MLYSSVDLHEKHGRVKIELYVLRNTVYWLSCSLERGGWTYGMECSASKLSRCSADAFFTRR